VHKVPSRARGINEWFGPGVPWPPAQRVQPDFVALPGPSRLLRLQLLRARR